MRKAHATRHRRQATKAREVECAKSLRLAREADERRVAVERARWKSERERRFGVSIMPWAGIVLTNGAALRLSGDREITRSYAHGGGPHPPWRGPLGHLRRAGLRSAPGGLRLQMIFEIRPAAAGPSRARPCRGQFDLISRP